MTGKEFLDWLYQDLRRHQGMLSPEATRKIVELAGEVDVARSHRCSLPASIIEALNSGDGTYRP